MMETDNGYFSKHTANKTSPLNMKKVVLIFDRSITHYLLVKVMFQLLFCRFLRKKGHLSKNYSESTIFALPILLSINLIFDSNSTYKLENPNHSHYLY